MAFFAEKYFAGTSCSKLRFLLYLIGEFNFFIWAFANVDDDNDDVDDDDDDESISEDGDDRFDIFGGGSGGGNGGGGGDVKLNLVADELLLFSSPWIVVLLSGL